jgi:hypothetical protein
MRRKRVIVGLAVLALVAAAAMLAWPRDPRPCRATFEQVRAGMTLEEVEAIVGGPPGVYTDRPVPITFLSVGFIAGSSYTEVHRIHQWAADDGTLEVFIGRDGRAALVSVDDPLPDTRPFIQRLRSRLGL